MKTLAIRLEGDLHAQLSILAQLAGTSITDEIRQAIERHVEAKKADPDLTGRAQSILDEIEREAAGRRAAISTLFGGPMSAAGAKPAGGRRATGNDDQPGR